MLTSFTSTASAGRSGPVRIRSFTLAFAGTAVFAAAGTASAASGPAATATPIAVAASARNYRPQVLRGDEPVKVVVRLQSDSVSEARAKTVSLSLTAAEEREILAATQREHDAIRPSLASLGARVVSEMHHAINGVAVMVPRKQIGSLAALPGVRSVNSARIYKHSNAVGIPYIGAPLVWKGHPGFLGDGVNVGIIDTGIDYTHADFGGPGTPAAYAAALATDTLAPDPTLVGPKAPKVKGGIDLVGDAYDASSAATSTPVPDPNPLDCASHGTHVAGTLAGFGVASGTTYTGPYNQAIYDTTSFDVGPGVAPHANIYSIKVFGCGGSTNVVGEAIDWAIANHLDVISMSLGSPYGTADTAVDADSIEVENATQAGIIVVAAAGNAGPAPYILGAPSSAEHAISVAAMDARAWIPAGVAIRLSDGSTVNAVEADTTLSLPSGTVPTAILTNGGALAFGCDASDYPAGGTPGALAIVSRGTCLFVQKAALATQAGAVAIGVVNNNPNGYEPPLIPGVTIPFLEMLLSDTGTILAAVGDTASLAAGPIPNPEFEVTASFSSGGPRGGDSLFKPAVTGPGVEVISAFMGSGNQGIDYSGTSMATPHVAGVAALARQAHPHWGPYSVAAAVVQASDPNKLVSFDPRLNGAGVLQAPGAASTQVVAFGDHRLPALSFGFDESTRDIRQTQMLTLKNHGSHRASFNVAYSPALTTSNVPHTLHMRETVSVDGNDEVAVPITIDIPAATVGGSHDSSGNDVYRDAAGVITLTPVGAANNGNALTVPYYLVPRVRSNVTATLMGNLSVKHPGTTLRIANRGANLPGTADFYSWGQYSAPVGDPLLNTRAVGIQTNLFPDGSDSVLVFAINDWGRVSNAAAFEWDIWIDSNGDGQPDYVLFASDAGSVTTGEVNGTLGVFLVDLSANAIVAEFIGEAPTDGSTVELPVYASMLGLSPSNPTLTYAVNFFNNFGSGYSMPGQGVFNAFSPSISASGSLFQVIPGGTAASVSVAIDPTQWAATPSIGLMVVSEDNAAGESEALLIKAH